MGKLYRWIYLEDLYLPTALGLPAALVAALVAALGLPAGFLPPFVSFGLSTILYLVSFVSRISKYCVLFSSHNKDTSSYSTETFAFTII